MCESANMIKTCFLSNDAAIFGAIKIVHSGPLQMGYATNKRNGCWPAANRFKTVGHLDSHNKHTRHTSGLLETIYVGENGEPRFGAPASAHTCHN